MPQPSRTHTVLKNSLFRLFGFFFPIIFSIAITPVVVNKLGTQDYGLMIFINSVLGILGLLDMGISTATIKHVAEYKGKGDGEGAVRSIRTANSLFLIIGILGMMLVGLIILGMTLFFGDKVANNPEIVTVMLIGAGLFFINSVNSVYTLIPSALQRFDIATAINAISLTVGSLANLAVVLLGGKLVAIFAVNALVATVFFFVWRKYSLAILPEAKWRFAWSASEVRRTISFSAYASVNEFARSTLFSLDRLIIPLYAGAASLTYYTIPGNLTARITGVSDNIAGTLFPLSAHLNATGEHDALRTGYVRSSRIILVVSTAIAAGLAFNGYEILRYWINAEVAKNGAMVMVILALTNLCLALLSSASNLFVVLGKWRFYTAISTSMAVVNVIALFVLLPRYGIEGAALAYLISTAPVIYALYVLEKKYLQIPGKTKRWVLNFSKIVATTLVFAVANGFLIKQNINGLTSLVILGPSSVLLWLAIYYVLGFVPREDRDDIVRFVRVMLRKRLPQAIVRRVRRLMMRISGDPRPSSAPYISGDSFRKMADHIYDETGRCSPDDIRERDVVFLKTDLIHEFFSKVHPLIRNRYTLITHNSDWNIGEAEARYADDKILHWFAQNVLVAHPKITPIPIGLENLHHQENGILSRFEAGKKKLASKVPKILFGFNVNTNPVKRNLALEALRKNPQADEIIERLNPEAYIKRALGYDFIASPEGNGLDCMRTWESLYLGAVPIVERSVSTEYFKSLGLSIWVIDSWDELLGFSEGDLRIRYNMIRSNSNDLALSTEYWKRLIRGNTATKA
jgi:O-antigen/teichoic acid export membrane protein